MKNVTIADLKKRLPVTYKYGERIVERAKMNGITLTTKDVYYTMSGRTKVYEPVIRKILEILIEESESELASIV